MNTVLWLLFCLLASIGLVQVGVWIYCTILRSRHNSNGYQIVTLPQNIAELEPELRYCIMCRNWGIGHDCCLLLIDNGLDEEGREICTRMLKNVIGVTVCNPQELDRILQSGTT